MKYVAAYLLAQLGGNAAPTASDLGNILGAVGIEADSSVASVFLNEVSGKSVDSLIAAGSSKLASMPSGGAAAPAAGKAAPAAAKAEEKKAAVKEVSEEEFDMDLFG